MDNKLIIAIMMTIFQFIGKEIYRIIWIRKQNAFSAKRCFFYTQSKWYR
jgi:hypothetical protein